MLCAGATGWFVVVTPTASRISRHLQSLQLRSEWKCKDWLELLFLLQLKLILNFTFICFYIEYFLEARHFKHPRSFKTCNLLLGIGISC